MVGMPASVAKAAASVVGWVQNKLNYVAAQG
jgi:hypothetical protein